MKASKRVVLMSGLMVCAAAAWAAEPVAWPAGTLDKKDPRIADFYQAQCSRWADDSALAGDERSAYLDKCVANAAKTYPVGYAAGGGGGE